MLGLAAAALSACTSSAGGTGPSSPSVSSPPATSSTPISASASLPGSSATKSGPTTPPRPSLPPDVPRHGPNTKPGEKPPIMPLEATQHTPDGAKAFAEFFIKTIDWGFATVSGSYIRHYAEPSCRSCSVLANGMDNDRKAGNRYIGGRFTLTAANGASHPLAKGAEKTVVVTFDVLSFEQVTKSGKFVKADQAHRGERFEVSLIRSDGLWRVVELGLDR